MPCRNHPLADAGLAECWVCGETFCPECLAELQGRMMCAPCKAEAVSRLEQGEQADATPGEKAPWERIGELGFFSAYVKTITSVMGAPGAFFERLDKRLSTYTCLGVPMITQTLVMAILFGFQMLVAGAISFAGAPGDAGGMFALGGAFLVIVIVLMPIGAVINIFIWSGLTHLVLVMTKKATLPFHQTMRGSCYAFAPYVVSAVPCVGVYVGLVWMAVAQIIMVMKMHRVSGAIAALAVLGFPMLLVCCGVTAGIIFAVAGASGR